MMFLQKSVEVKARASEKYKEDPVTLNRILVALNEYKEQVQLKGTQQKGSSKVGTLRGAND